MTKYFEDFDFSTFWEDSEYAREEYIESNLSQELINKVENELGYKLPASYIEFMTYQNGGIPINTCLPTNTSTSWASDHVAITGIMGIGKEKTCSLCGEVGSPFWEEEWGYPKIGIYFCDCPSAGHDMICLDYQSCGKNGEPRVVHVDQECDYDITVLADNFEQFIRNLVNVSVFDDE